MVMIDHRLLTTALACVPKIAARLLYAKFQRLGETHMTIRVIVSFLSCSERATVRFVSWTFLQRFLWRKSKQEVRLASDSFMNFVSSLSIDQRGLSLPARSTMVTVPFLTLLCLRCSISTVRMQWLLLDASFLLVVEVVRLLMVSYKNRKASFSVSMKILFLSFAYNFCLLTKSNFPLKFSSSADILTRQSHPCSSSSLINSKILLKARYARPGLLRLPSIVCVFPDAVWPYEKTHTFFPKTARETTGSNYTKTCSCPADQLKMPSNLYVRLLLLAVLALELMQRLDVVLLIGVYQGCCNFLSWALQLGQRFEVVLLLLVIALELGQRFDVVLGVYWGCCSFLSWAALALETEQRLEVVYWGCCSSKTYQFSQLTKRMGVVDISELRGRMRQKTLIFPFLSCSAIDNQRCFSLAF